MPPRVPRPTGSSEEACRFTSAPASATGLPVPALPSGAALRSTGLLQVAPRPALALERLKTGRPQWLGEGSDDPGGNPEEKHAPRRDPQDHQEEQTCRRDEAALQVPCHTATDLHGNAKQDP